MTKEEILKDPVFAKLNEVLKKFPKEKGERFYKWLEKQDFSEEGCRRFFIEEIKSHWPDGTLRFPYV